ncbi:F-box/LRR-repeat protein 7-like isoform X2 [Watersipora subatra]|uniref:F-box/LRR-repeat protein 7-like isoform X2 n=1 Tax=Watersipora subatra TaxID=2589382 RepID=UPI00355B7592
MTDSTEELKRTIYVTNISHEALWKTNLADIFEVFGEITSIDYIQPRNNNRFAFVTFSTLSSAQKAFEVASSENGLYYEGHRLYVAPRRPKRANIKEDVQRLLKQRREWQPTGPALIETLDVYCMLHIFSYLTLSELILCEDVCQRWREISQQCWSTIEELPFSDISYPVEIDHKKKLDILKRCTTGALRYLNLCWNIPKSELLELLEVVPPSVTSFTITTADIYQPEVLDIAARAMPNLQEINENSQSDNSDDEGLFKLLTAFPKVTQLTMGVSDRPFKWSLDGTNVQKLTLLTGEPSRTEVVASLIDKIGSNLKELFWCQVSMGNVDVALNCPHLKKFIFKGYFSHDPRKVLIDFSGAPKLEELSICKELVHCKLGRENMLLNCTKIKKLQLQYDSKLDASLHFLLFRNWPKLTHLDVNYTLVPGMLEELVKLKELEKLRMRGTGSVYEHELVDLIDALPKLKHLDVTGVEILDEDGSKIKDIEPLCNQCLSDGRPDIEFCILDCGLDEKERLRWRCGRFILYNPKWLDFLL